ILGDDDLRHDRETVGGDDLAIRIGAEGAGAGVQGCTVRALDLEPALAVQGQIELVARMAEGALNVEAAHGHRLDTEADIHAFGNDVLVCPHGTPLKALDLIEKIGEFSTRPLEASGVD